MAKRMKTVAVEIPQVMLALGAVVSKSRHYGIGNIRVTTEPGTTCIEATDGCGLIEVTVPNDIAAGVTVPDVLCPPKLLKRASRSLPELPSKVCRRRLTVSAKNGRTTVRAVIERPPSTKTGKWLTVAESVFVGPSATGRFPETKDVWPKPKQKRATILFKPELMIGVLRAMLALDKDATVELSIGKPTTPIQLTMKATGKIQARAAVMPCD